MMLEFAANLSTMFTEVELIKRFKAAKENGFKYVEIQSPYSIESHILQKEKVENNLQVVLINTWEGERNELNTASIPGEECNFCSSLNQSIKYSFDLGYPKIHILAGYKDPRFSEEEQELTFISNLKNAASVLEETGSIGLLEPICDDVKKNYFLNSFEKAVHIIKSVDRENIKLLLDIYHLHKIEGDVEENLDKYYPFQGHIQISQDPERREPFFPGGLINYENIFKSLEKKNHRDPIGLEYSPSGF